MFLAFSFLVKSSPGCGHGPAGELQAADLHELRWGRAEGGVCAKLRLAVEKS